MKPGRDNLIGFRLIRVFRDHDVQADLKRIGLNGILTIGVSRLSEQLNAVAC